MNLNTDNQINLLEQAQAARASSNWSLLIQCLQQLISGEIVPVSQNTLPVETLHATSLQAELLDLALAALVAGDFQQRWDIAKIFPKLGHSAITPLIEILEDEDVDEELSWFVVRILGEYNHPSVIAALVELLKTDQDELSAMAAAALGQIGSPAVAALTELLVAEDTRLLAVRSLSHIRRSETIAPLLSVIHDPQVDIRAVAVEALSSFHDSRIPPVLLNALDDPVALVRVEAVTGLSFRPDLREELDLVNRLVPQLYDFNLDVCCATAIALGRLGTDAAATSLFQVLKSIHTPAKLQIELIRSLGRMGTLSALEYLHLYLTTVPPLSSTATLCQELVTVLGRVEQPLAARASEILSEMLPDHPATQHQSVRQAIALSLGQLGDVRALELLIQLLADPDTGVKLHVIAALKQLDPEAAYQRLEQMATDESLAPELQQGVAIALAEWADERLLPNSGNLF